MTDTLVAKAERYLAETGDHPANPETQNLIRGLLDLIRCNDEDHPGETAQPTHRPRTLEPRPDA